MQAPAQANANVLASSQFINKGSMSSNNQQMLMRMQMQQHGGAPATHHHTGAASAATQVHNIQIKPISSTKRRPGHGTSNLIQAQGATFQGSA